MQLQPVFETVTATAPQIQVVDHVKTDCKTDVVSESIKKVLNVAVFPSLINTSTEDGKIKYTAKAVFYVCYLDQNDEVRKSECSNEFSGIMTCEDTPGRAVTHLSVEKTEADVSGINLKVSALISVKAEIFKNAEIQALSGGEDLVCNREDMPFKRGFGIKEGAYPVEEQFTLPYQVEEVLYHRAEPIITAVQCGVGSIIIDGEVRLSAILLQKGEKKDIIKTNKNLPYRVEIEYEDAMPSFTAISKVSLKSFKTDVEVDADGDKSQVTLSAMLAFNSEAFSTETVPVATDLFSLSHDVETDKQENLVCDVDDVRTCTHKTNCVFPCDENPAEVTIKAIAGEKVEILSVCATNGELLFTGTLTATAYFVTSDLKTFTRKIDLPLEFKCDCAISDGCYIDAIAVAECNNCSLTANGIEFDLEMTLTVYPTKQKRFVCIKDVKCVCEKQQKACAISVYLAYKNEDLWSLAKRLNVKPEILSETNPDLKFPLDGTERIVIYRQI